MTPERRAEIERIINQTLPYQPNSYAQQYIAERVNIIRELLLEIDAQPQPTQTLAEPEHILIAGIVGALDHALRNSTADSARWFADELERRYQVYADFRQARLQDAAHTRRALGAEGHAE